MPKENYEAFNNSNNEYAKIILKKLQSLDFIAINTNIDIYRDCRKLLCPGEKTNKCIVYRDLITVQQNLEQVAANQSEISTMKDAVVFNCMGRNRDKCLRNNLAN